MGSVGVNTNISYKIPSEARLNQIESGARMLRVKSLWNGDSELADIGRLLDTATHNEGFNYTRDNNNILYQHYRFYNDGDRPRWFRNWNEEEQGHSAEQELTNRVAKVLVYEYRRYLKFKQKQS